MCGDITGRINRSNNRVRMSSYVQTAGPVTSAIVERRDNLLIEIFTLMAARPSHKRGNLQSLNFRPSQTDELGIFANDQDRSQRDPSVPCQCSGSGARRLAPAHQRDEWPERETVADASQGVQLATMQKLARYWATEYDWRKCEAKLNALPHFITEIDGLDIHFIHVRSKHENALPLIVTHGWPGSIIEQLKIIDPLTNPTAHGGSAADAFHLVIPSMPGYGFSGKPTTTGWDPDRIARAWTVLMKRLGYTRYVAQGGDWGALDHRSDGRAGAAGTARHPHQHAGRGSARHRQGGLCRRPAAGRPLGRREARVRAARFFYKHGLAYAQEMGNRPQTLYGIADSPVGLAAWILDHDARSYELIARVFDGTARGPHAGRHPRQHHALLADEHGGLLGSSLLGKQARLLRARRTSPSRLP